MDNSDQELITGLADRIRQAQPVQKDPQAAELIGQLIAAQPDAVYVLTQAVLVQEDALRTAQARIAELTERLAAQPPATPAPPQSNGGFLSGMFGRNQQAAPAPVGAQPQGPSGGSFMKTAAAAAVGIAGGGLLLQGLNSTFGGHEAEASEAHSADSSYDESDEEEEW